MLGIIDAIDVPDQDLLTVSTRAHDINRYYGFQRSKIQYAIVLLHDRDQIYGVDDVEALKWYTKGLYGEIVLVTRR